MTGPLVADAGPLIALSRVDKLGLQEEARFLLIDDARGRAAARRCGIAVVGVAGILLVAKARGELVAVGPVLDELGRVGYWLSDRLIAEVRTRAGEGNA